MRGTCHNLSNKSLRTHHNNIFIAGHMVRYHKNYGITMIVGSFIYDHHNIVNYLDLPCQVRSIFSAGDRHAFGKTHWVYQQDLQGQALQFPAQPLNASANWETSDLMLYNVHIWRCLNVGNPIGTSPPGFNHETLVIHGIWAICLMIKWLLTINNH